MSKKIPTEIKLSPHARQRLYERKDAGIKYNMANIMRSSVKWWGKDHLIHDCALYRHCCYTTRKSNQIGYITDGDIEIIYNKNTHIAITVLEVKDKFKPIIQYIKPEIIKQLEVKKERKKMDTEPKPKCLDCGKDAEVNKNGICIKCQRRKNNMKSRGQEYIPYLELSESEQRRIDALQAAHSGQKRRTKVTPEPEPELTVPDNNNYYMSKANQEEVLTHPMTAPVTPIKPVKLNNAFDPLSDQATFVKILRDCGCEIPEESLNDVLDVLVNTDKLKDIFMTIAKSDSQQAMLDLEQALNVVERKLQHDWEYNGFQEVDDIKFKGFLTWRRVLKGAIFFWKKLYQTNTIIEMQRAWNAYTQDPNDKILLTGDRIDSTMKRFQITTESISTIFNTRRPFTRVFYATDQNVAYNMFKQWMADRNLHENKSKTTIVELKAEGEDGRKK